MRSSVLKSETEGFNLAAQDQNLPTRSYQRYILMNRTDPKFTNTEATTDYI